MNTLYLVECDYGRYGKAFRETDRDTNSRAAVIALICSEEISPVKVLEVCEDEGTCRDVTAELIEAAEVERKEEHVSASMRELNSIDHARDLRKHEVA